MKVPETVDLSHVRVMQGSWMVESVMEEVVAAGQEDPFYVMDLGEVVARYQRWVHLTPRVTPYYAILRSSSCLQDAALPYLGEALPKLAHIILAVIAKNPSKPHFNHYLLAMDNLSASY